MRITNKVRKAARYVAEGTLRQVDICEEIGVSRQTLIRWKNQEEFKKLIDSYYEPLLDTDSRERTLLETAYTTLDNVMKHGLNEGAKVQAAKYVVEKFRKKAAGKEADIDHSDMQQILKLVEGKKK
ncbi:MAG: hypothetical protein CMK59_05390 [Proteobacteria bacterium]|nr:hypothetical protein [Pseudomonadota bacterium]|tara:strand:+ start:469 stop:846 length:378 start_codon:yes stop_codon:yes gene_type:complete